MAQNQEGKWKVRLAGIVKNVHEKCFGYYKSYRELVPILPAESKCMLPGGMEDVCRVVIGCAQPDGWNITSVDPNVE